MCDRHGFVFEIDKAYTAQLIQKFEASPAHRLGEEIGPPQPGIYALYRRGRIVYAGKAMGATTLKRRLAEHARKIAGRRNILLGQMTCRFLIIESEWYVWAGEFALIQTYEPDWNASGFGSHVPGRGRPGIRVCRWDREFPPR